MHRFGRTVRGDDGRVVRSGERPGRCGRRVMTRRDEVLVVADRAGGGAVVLATPPSFAWYTEGADNRVDRAADRGIACIVATTDGEWVLTDSIEAERLRDEQLGDRHLQVVSHPWYEAPWPTLRELVGDAVVVADVAIPGANLVGDDLARCRLQLSDIAQQQYVTVGADARAALDAAASALHPDETERAAAA